MKLTPTQQAALRIIARHGSLSSFSGEGVRASTMDALVRAGLVTTRSGVVTPRRRLHADLNASRAPKSAAPVVEVVATITPAGRAEAARSAK